MSRSKDGVYYHHKKDKIEVICVDNTMIGYVDYSWWSKDNGWANSKKGYPDEDGWVYVGDFFTPTSNLREGEDG